MMKTQLQHSREVAPGIYQVRLPLPFALNHVNCYLLRDDDGWTLLDAGLHQPNIRVAWEAALAELGIEPGQIHQIVLTHMHPDHFGLSGYAQALTGAPVYLSPRERELAQAVWIEDNWRLDAHSDYWRAGGVPTAVRSVINEQTGHLREMTMPHPHAISTIEPGAIVEMGSRRFRAIHAPGHSDGQLIFFDASDGLMICGDQVLMKITPNIGLWPTTEPDPLGRYMASLRELVELPVRLALPGHGPLITAWHARVEELLAHHELRLGTMQRATEGGATALEVSRRVFDFGVLTEHEVRFAVAEAMAHLDHLARASRITYTDNGVRTYRA